MVIWTIMKGLFWLACAYLAYKIAVQYQRQKQLEAQGVVFNSYFSIVSDVIRIMYYSAYYPSENCFKVMME